MMRAGPISTFTARNGCASLTSSGTLRGTTMAIIGIHAIMYSKKDEETRAFLRDILGLSSVDAGRGWLIFAAPPTELAVHPTDGEEYHELYLMCDDLDATIAELKQKGVESGEI